ncbi:MAG TPA: pyridoxal phosphate-dependent aminotransferase [Nocardioides sp.]
MPHLSQRLQGIPPTVFTEMSALAIRTGSVNLGQGFPDSDGPRPTIERARRALAEGENQYAPGPGRPELREAIARHQKRHYGLGLDPATDVVVTTGATEAIAAAVLGLVDPGDEVILLEPFYDSYVAVLQMTGAVRRPVTLRAPAFRLDVEAMRAAVTERTRFVLLNSPHNPTGTVLHPDELRAVADLAIEHDLVVITDEVYEHLTYGVEHVPIATLPGMAERTLTISSVGKSWSFTGWKVGWATGPAELAGAVLAAKQWLTFTSAGPLQSAVAEALDAEDAWPAGLAADLRVRRDLLCDGLAEVGLAPTVPEGTYFVTTDVEHLGHEDGRAFCLDLPRRAGVVAIPLQGFHDDIEAGRHLVRWAFCKDRSVIEDGLRRLKAAELRA